MNLGYMWDFEFWKSVQNYTDDERIFVLFVFKEKKGAQAILGCFRKLGIVSLVCELGCFKMTKMKDNWPALVMHAKITGNGGIPAQKVL